MGGVVCARNMGSALSVKSSEETFTSVEILRVINI